MSGVGRRQLFCGVLTLFLGSCVLLSTMTPSSERMWLWLSQQPFVPAKISGIMIKCDSGTDKAEENIRSFVSYDGEMTIPDTNEDRLERINKICRSTNRPTTGGAIYQHPERLQNILVDDKLKTMFCYIPKAGSTSWKFVLLNSSKRSHEPHDAKQFRDIHTTIYKTLRRLDDFSPEDIKYRLENYFKFMVVRHPLERLGSAYYDRFYLIEQGNTEHGNAGTYRDYKDKIVETTKGTDVSSSCIGFDRFVKYLTLSDPSEFDEHWSLYDRVCSPCAIQYDYVGKVETMETDSPQIMRRLNISGVELPKYHVHHKENSSYLRYYNKVLPQDIQSLLQIYSIDFDLFGYTVPITKEVQT